MDAALTRELHQVRSQEAEEEQVPDRVDALFVGEYEPVRYAAADKSGEKQAAEMAGYQMRAGSLRAGRARLRPSDMKT